VKWPNVDGGRPLKKTSAEFVATEMVLESLVLTDLLLVC
jgi:hypothetical protein